MIESLIGPLSGLIISQQEPGTVITHPVTGDELIVTDGSFVNLGHTIYVTPKTYEALKLRLGGHPGEGE